ncbi:hypothetical protein ACO22_03974 [Paracoccidioides brasiliensis]|uniref:Uncharacterized protein n=1 Tax=Paracoccidioides brasiliensis TaxID=121759 RepID=A0A1D2JEC4_PARBR|nr:hypothetical protein ACO22_03974 [Paracoccidioides brasiliensis]
MSVKEGEVQGMAFDDSGRANLTSIQGQFNKLIVKAYLYVTGNPKGGNKRVEFVPQASYYGLAHRTIVYSIPEIGYQYNHFRRPTYVHQRKLNNYFLTCTPNALPYLLEQKKLSLPGVR